MKIDEIAKALECQVLAGAAQLSQEAEGGYVSDLLSDVMGHAREGQVWITLQTHLNVMAIAGLKELAAVVIVKNLPVSAEVIAKAEEEDIPLLQSPLSAFECAGRLYALLQHPST